VFLRARLLGHQTKNTPTRELQDFPLQLLFLARFLPLWPTLLVHAWGTSAFDQVLRLPEKGVSGQGDPLLECRGKTEETLLFEIALTIKTL